MTQATGCEKQENSALRAASLYIWGWLTAWLRGGKDKRVLRDLHGMDDRMLRDINVTRDEVEEIQWRR